LPAAEPADQHFFFPTGGWTFQVHSGPLATTAQPSVTVQLTSLKLLMHILQNAATAGAVVAVNAASRNRLSAADRQQNYLDRMSTATRQQQWDRDYEHHTKACAQLTDQEWQQQRECKQHAKAHARLIDQER